MKQSYEKAVNESRLAAFTTNHPADFGAGLCLDESTLAIVRPRFNGKTWGRN